MSIKKLVWCLLTIIFPNIIFAKVVTESLWTAIDAENYFSNSKEFAYIIHTDVRNINVRYPLGAIVGSYGAGYFLHPKLTAWVGYYRSIYFPYHGSVQNSRFWQQLYWHTVNNEKLQVNLRTRLEENRYTGLYHTYPALRQLIEIVPEKYNYGPIQPWIFEEIFLPFNYHKDIHNVYAKENRFFVGILYNLSKTEYFQIGYLNQYLQGYSLNVNVMNHVLYFAYVFGDAKIIKPVAE